MPTHKGAMTIRTNMPMPQLKRILKQSFYGVRKAAFLLDMTVEDVFGHITEDGLEYVQFGTSAYYLPIEAVDEWARLRRQYADADLSTYKDDSIAHY